MPESQETAASAVRRSDYISYEHGSSPQALFVAFELGFSSWKLAFATQHGEKPRRRSVDARDMAALEQELARAKARLKWRRTSRCIAAMRPVATGSGFIGTWLYAGSRTWWCTRQALRCSITPRPTTAPFSGSGFALIEFLVVISIIALRGEAAHKVGRGELAASDLEQAVVYTATFRNTKNRKAGLLNTLGVVYRDLLKDDQKAIVAFRRTQRTSKRSDGSRATFAIADIYLKQGKPGKAVQVVNDWLAQVPAEQRNQFRCQNLGEAHVVHSVYRIL